MITKHEMFHLIVKASPGFQDNLNTFTAEWECEGEDLPIYLLLTDLAVYIKLLIEIDAVNELRLVFNIVERWHLEGDSYVKESATIGLLEDLQNVNVVGKITPNKVETYLLSESRKMWLELYRFWEG